jgi:hypothetical protein
MGLARGGQHKNSNTRFWQSQVRFVVSLRLASLSDEHRVLAVEKYHTEVGDTFLE